MNRLDSVKLFAVASESCNRCGMDTHTSHGCCHDEVKVVKMAVDQQQTIVADHSIPAMELPVSIPPAFISASFERPNIAKHFHNHIPPLLSAQDTYLQINVFRI
jgi:hypothetical protein